MTISILRFTSLLTTFIFVKKIFGTEDLKLVHELPDFSKYSEKLQPSFKNEMLKEIGEKLRNSKALTSYNIFFNNEGKKDENDLNENLPSFVGETDSEPFRSSDFGLNDSHSIYFQKKFRSFDKFGNDNNEYLLYDWGPNPQIWGSLRQGKKESDRIVIPKKNKYPSKTGRGGYGWHSNQNLWGKRSDGISVSDQPFNDRITYPFRKQLSLVPVTTYDDVLFKENRMDPFRRKLNEASVKAYESIPFKEYHTINLNEYDEKNKPKLRKITSALTKDLGTYWVGPEWQLISKNYQINSEDETGNNVKRLSNGNQNSILNETPQHSTDLKMTKEYKILKILNLFEHFLNANKVPLSQKVLKPENLNFKGNIEGFRGKKGIDKLFQNLGNLSGTFFTPRG